MSKTDEQNGAPPYQRKQLSESINKTSGKNGVIFGMSGLALAALGVASILLVAGIIVVPPVFVPVAIVFGGAGAALAFGIPALFVIDRTLNGSNKKVGTAQPLPNKSRGVSKVTPQKGAKKESDKSAPNTAVGNPRTVLSLWKRWTGRS